MGPDARIPRDERRASEYPAVSTDQRRAWMEEFGRIETFVWRAAETGGEKGTTHDEFVVSIRREFPFMNDEAVGRAWFLANYYAWHEGYM